jgi:hypothetical protein
MLFSQKTECWRGAPVGVNAMGREDGTEGEDLGLTE